MNDKAIPNSFSKISSNVRSNIYLCLRHRQIINFLFSKIVKACIKGFHFCITFILPASKEYRLKVEQKLDHWSVGGFDTIERSRTFSRTKEKSRGSRAQEFDLWNLNLTRLPFHIQAFEFSQRFRQNHRAAQTDPMVGQKSKPAFKRLIIAKLA